MSTVKIAWQEFKHLDRDTYLLTEDELDCTWKKSTDEVLEKSILKLSESGHIRTSINVEGKLVYSVTEYGLDYLKRRK